jgi:hypothetical protein
LQRAFEALVISGDALFKGIELGILIDLPPFSLEHSVRGVGGVPAAACGVGWRDDDSGCAGFLVDVRGGVGGARVVWADGFAAGDED